MFIGKVNNLFNVDAINRKFNRNTTNEEEKVFYVMILQQYRQKEKQ